MITMRIGSWVCGAILVGATAGAQAAATKANAKYVVEKGQKIAFLGDSITAAGRRKGGYCQLVLEGLNKEGLEVTGVFAGIGGHKSNQMLARLDRDVLNHKPDWMTLSCGVNDVWHGARGVRLEPYMRNITEIVARAQAAGVKVMLLTSTMIKEDQNNALNQKLVPYNAFLRQLAKARKCLLADLNADMQEALKTFPEDAPKGKQLTGDGVHMNGLGNIMMANGVLKAFRVPVPKKPTAVEDPALARKRRELSAIRDRELKAKRLYDMAKQAERLGQRGVAAALYSKLVKEYPKTPSAERAAKKLDSPRK